ncbi:glycopeptide antibiotics resistance protein [Microbacteriaceae bacterium SG_E_30_P1]|uniref:Glycopeptide antibiotics resistance protein n=1 Tax=Antiquaquibacter oligotrophicus TaxID=2880260 RepID=A0ABT6KS04_9MICO|nr:VanZ family protein [Antiquaquibacter oligotrophicus]MDH6181982.1 glycopeptide antibiotics resistance protein [Antiquaquibacter oligotrophicus]UDF12349.1 VanZ family protein [Antiquaquibacter oligotrophicus]
MQQRTASRLPTVALVVGAAYLVILLAMTVTPVLNPNTTLGFAGGAFRAEAWLSPSTWTGGWSGELLANVILFIPLGWLAARLLPLPLAIVVPVVISVGIEFAQLFLPGRVSDPRDLVANTAGALLGVLLARALARPAPTSRAVRQ